MRHIDAAGLAKIKAWEGFVPHAYDDAFATKEPVDPGETVHGTLTIGYGHTLNVKPGDKITEKQAVELLKQDLVGVENAVERLVKVPLTDGQFAALVSFVFNVGAGAFRGSTLLKELNKGNYDAVPKELMKWTKTTIGGKKITSAGLTNRRAAEIGLWATGNYVASNTIPAAPASKPLVTMESVGVGAAAVGSLGTALDGTGPVQYALAGLIVVGFLMAGYVYLKKRVFVK